MSNAMQTSIIRLSAWLLSVAGIIMLTTLPWSNFVGHAHWEQVRWIPFSPPLALTDLVGNVALFFPFGYFFPKRFRGRSARYYGIPLLSALVFSTAVEAVQLYSHGRIASMTDVVANLAGAALGLIPDRHESPV